VASNSSDIRYIDFVSGESPIFSVLVVEDDENDQALKSRALAEIGLPLNIAYATDGEIALDLLQRASHPLEGCFNLIILDMGLPKRSGIEVLAEIRRLDPKRAVPVVAISGSHNPLIEAEANALGVHSWLVKPLNYSEHLWMIRRAARFWLLGPAEQQAADPQ
jgi:CheY-like chemotaxis protein